MWFAFYSLLINWLNVYLVNSISVVWILFDVYAFISVPLEYITPLKDDDVKEGESAVLTCEVNKADVAAVWCKEGEKINSDDSKYTITQENFTHTLVIADCDVNDDAEYTITIDEEYTSVGNVFVEGDCLAVSTLSFHDRSC